MKIIITESQFKKVFSEQQINKKFNTGKKYFWNKDYSEEFNALIEKRNKNIAFAQKTWNVNSLNKAIDWWKKWLADPKTKSQFSKNWKFTPQMTDSVFSAYNNALSGLKIEYLYEPHNNAIAYVYDDPNLPKIVYVNAAYTEGVEPVETFIHELQHKLFGVHPLHPSQKINQDLNIDFSAGVDFLKFPKFMSRLDNSSLVKSPFDKTKESIDPHYEKKMTNLGLDEKNKQRFRNFIKQLNPQQVQYIAGGHDLNGTEIVSRLEALRYTLGKKPGEPITISELGKLGASNTNSYWTILSILLSFYDVNSVLNNLNQYAMNTPKKTVPNPNTANQNYIA